MSWNWRQRRARLLLGVALTACVLALARPGTAHAGYPLASQGRVALAFGATYTAAEATASSTHRGVDITAEAGARVTAPLAGTVTFAGRVPAVGGGTVRAVTLSTASGSITLLPLANVSVAKGDSLAEGDAVGALAGDGDGSSAETHLHVGVRRGDLYVDPLSVLTSPVALSVAPGGNAPAGVGATQGSASAGTAAAVHAATVGRTASSAGAAAASAARAHVAAAVRGGVPVGLNAGSSALHPAVPGASLAPGVSVGGVAPRAAPSYAAASAESALTRLRAVGLSPAGAQATARVAGSTLDAVLAQARRTAGQAARVAGMAAATVLGGIGLLWPLWRREERKGSGEDRVSAIADDVAAAVGR